MKRLLQNMSLVTLAVGCLALVALAYRGPSTRPVADPNLERANAAAQLRSAQAKSQEQRVQLRETAEMAALRKQVTDLTAQLAQQDENLRQKEIAITQLQNQLAAMQAHPAAPESPQPN